MESDGGVSGLQLQHNGLQLPITGTSSQSSIREWLTTTITEEDAKHEPLREAAELLRRNPSGDDDLALGIEASLYGKQGVRTVQDFLRWSRTSPALSRWNSISSTPSGHSGPLSVMDILNLWKDDPEEFLLDLGFGCDEPDLSGRIPARFINYQSQARGINLQVFLEAQKSRMDLENPDVSNRFRQLEVLQQVTTAFSSLVGSSPSKAPLDKGLPPEARERRRRMGMLLRRASKKSLSQMHGQKALDLSTAEVALQPPPGPGDRKGPSKRPKPGPMEAGSLSPLAEELGAGQEAQVVVCFMTQEAAPKPGALREGHPLTVTSLLQRKKSQWQAKESFEMEEIHSFDEGSVTGATDNIVRGLIRTNSCQSDSSGFLEEPFVPPLPPQGSPAPDLIKALAGLSGASTDSHSEEKPGSPPPLYPHTSTSPPRLPAAGAEKPPSPRPSPQPSSGLSVSPPLVNSDPPGSEAEASPHEDRSLPGAQLPTERLASPERSTPPPSPPAPVQTASLIKSDNKDARCLRLPDSGHTAHSSVSIPPSVASPTCDSPLPASVALSSGSCWNPGSKEGFLHMLPDSASGGFSSQEACPSLPSLAPLRLSDSSQSQDPDALRDPAAETVSDLSRPVNTDPAPTSAVLDVIHVKMDDVPLHLEDTLQREGKGEVAGERRTDTEQTTETDVYIPDTEGSLSECSRLVSEELSKQTDPQIHQDAPYRCSKDELSGETGQESVGKVCDVETRGTGGESSVRPLVFRLQEVVEESSCIKADPKNLIAIESLDMVFETSVDGSEFDNGEGDAFFRQLDTEGQVFWAEPVQICFSPPLLEESGGFEAFDGAPGPSDLREAPRDPISPTDVPLDGRTSPPPQTVSSDQTFRPATDRVDALPASSPSSPSSSSGHKPLSRSVSVQMSSSPSSHIVHRKDVPYVTDSKRTLPPPVLPLDTSSPFRAVQSWTDLRMQRNKNLSCELLDTVPNEVMSYRSAPENIQRAAQMSSSTPSFPVQSNNWQSHESLAGKGRKYRTVSVSVDTGLSSHQNKDNNRNGGAAERERWERETSTLVCCCCSCDRQCACCLQRGPKKQQSLEPGPFSLDELEEMMLCLQQFCSVLSNMEEQLSEDQAAVYSALSDHDRENVRHIEELRRAVKQEAGELEKQLNDLAHHYDDSLKMMHRLLDEQSLLCSQLQVFLPRASNPTSNRTVATQCSLMPWFAAGHMHGDHVSSWSAWKEDSTRVIPPGLENICEGLGSSPTKADKMDIVGFLQRLRESLHHSVNTDSLE
ncbi:uncharacterized protein itprid1 isoform X2 [Betta splendens]|uniref:Uncharacterized protein itprid1 isoform X2 n=1 Tax=Betta splendens TaxID=158456 RepID=A0A6P7MG08_BETSP|nr:uncharacterized protein itprid1 isoform X2 [Betta splendens]